MSLCIVWLVNLIENHNDFSQTVLIGIQPRGGFLAKRLVRLLQNDYKIKDVQLGLVGYNLLP